MAIIIYDNINYKYYLKKILNQVCVELGLSLSKHESNSNWVQVEKTWSKLQLEYKKWLPKSIQKLVGFKVGDKPFKLHSFQS